MRNILKLTFLLWLATNLNAEEIFIDSIKSSEGTVLECSLPQKDSLILSIMGENGKSIISATRYDKYWYIKDYSAYYAQPIYENSSNIFTVLEVERKMYFYKGKPLRGTVSDTELDKSMESYNILQKALKEAHDKGKCLAWKL